MQEAYADIEGLHWKEDQIEKLLKVFPEEQICVEVDGRVVASALSLIVDYAAFGDNHTYEQITGNYSFDTHEPDGDVDMDLLKELHSLGSVRVLKDRRTDLYEVRRKGSS